MSPWGVPTAGGVVPYFQAEDAAVLARVGAHDKNVFLINGNGWIQFGDTFPEYALLFYLPLTAPDEVLGHSNLHSMLHPTPNGHSKVAYHAIDYLLKWGLKAA
jgi:hypothetical protein